MILSIGVYALETLDEMAYFFEEIECQKAYYFRTYTYVHRMVLVNEDQINGWLAIKSTLIGTD